MSRFISGKARPGESGSTEGTLRDLAFRSPAEGHSPMLHLPNPHRGI